MLDKINERIKSAEKIFEQSRQRLASLKQQQSDLKKEIKSTETLIDQTRGAYQALSELTVEETPA